MAEYNPSKIIKDGNTYNFKDTTKIPLAGSNEISGSLIPSTDGTVNLGSSSYQWNNAYIKSLTINGVACGDILTHNASEFVKVTGNETIEGTKTFSSQIKGNISGTSSDVVVGSDTATSRGYLVDNTLPRYTWEDGSQLIAGGVPLITNFNNLSKPGVYHVVFCLNDGYVHEEKEYKESLNRPSIPNITTGFRDGVLEIKQTATMYNITSYHRCIQKLTLLSGNSNHGFIGQTYQRVCINLSNKDWTAWKRVARDEEVVHTSGNETISGVKTFSNDVRISKTSPFFNAFCSSYIKGQAPASNLNSGVRFYDDINSGSANTITGGFEIEYNRNGYNKSYISSRNYAGEIHKNFTVGLRVPNDDIRSIDFFPSGNGIINLGTSTNKWKTINGINPGALSLPNASPSGFISKSLPASGGTIAAEVDGWFELRTKATSPNAWIQLFVAGGSSSYAKNTGDTLIISVPMRVGISVTIFYRDIETPTVCRLVPCAGNV